MSTGTGQEVLNIFPEQSLVPNQFLVPHAACVCNEVLGYCYNENLEV